MQEDFLQALRETCRDLFAAYDLALEPADDGDGSCGIAGVIGFVGDGIRGSLVLASVAGVSRSTCPVKSTEASAATEWMGELANQLLGRLKNHYFLAHGVDVRMSAPVAVSGTDLSCILGDHSGRLGAVSFHSAAGPVVIWSHIMTEPGFVMGPRQESGLCAEEGAMELF